MWVIDYGKSALVFADDSVKCTSKSKGKIRKEEQFNRQIEMNAEQKKMRKEIGGILKKWFSKYKLILTICALIFLGLIILVGINWLLRTPAPIELLDAEWGPDAALGFYGVLLAAVLAVVGVCATIKDSTDKHRTEQRNSILPYIAFTRLKAEFSHPLFASFYYGIENSKSTDDEQDFHYKGYQEKQLQELWIQVDNNKISFLYDLSEAQKEMFRYSNAPQNQGKPFSQCTVPLCIPFILKNVGVGAAINVRIGLYRENTDQEIATPVMSLSVSPNDEFTIRVFAEKMSGKNDIWGKYILIIRYENIFGDLYEQRCGIELQSEADDGASVTTKILQGQQLIKEGQA